MVFRWPDKIRKGLESKQIVSNYDLLPTFADLLDVKLTTAKDGMSLLPILLEGKKRLPERYIYLSSEEGPAVVDSKGWKLRYNDEMKKFRLHYLPDDYREEKILNEKYPQIFSHLKVKLEEETHLRKYPKIFGSPQTKQERKMQLK